MSPEFSPPRFARWLTAALCAAPLLALADDNCTSPNTDSDYILGDVGGTASAMHWETGLVWKRCLEGESFANGHCSTDAAQSTTWNQWAETDGLLPQSFDGQTDWGISEGFSQNLLQSGAWRMAYENELVGITDNCGIGPKINRVVFPDTPFSVVWSGSPNGYPINAWVVYFYGAYAYNTPRNSAYNARLVRGGQSFAPLVSPAAQTAAAGTQAAFASVTLVRSTGADPDAAWGGARISGDGSPEFQVNGTGAWVQEAIVQSGDQITVRLTAPATGSRTATLALRSGQTIGTADAANPGDEATAMQETTASFTVNALPVAPQLAAVMGGIAGTAEPGSTVEVFEGGNSLGTATTDATTGAWSFALATGPHTLTVTATNGFGTSDPSAPLALNVPLFDGAAGSAQVAITSDINGCTLGSPPAFAAAAPADALPANATAPQGLLRFTAANCTGGTLTVQVAYPGSLAGLAPYKFGPATTGATAGWFPHGSVNGSTVTYTVTDNSTGDNDTAAGAISDPHALLALASAPAPAAQAIPTLGEWALALLAGVLGLLSAGALRRRGAARG